MTASAPRSLRELAEAGQLPDHQVMDRPTLDWIARNRPVDAGVGATLPHRPVLLVPEVSWFARTETATSIHGVLHGGRGAVLLQLLAVDQGLAPGQALALAAAAACHDCRRHDDRADPGHGERAARWLTEHSTVPEAAFGAAPSPEAITAVALHDVPHYAFTPRTGRHLPAAPQRGGPAQGRRRPRPLPPPPPALVARPRPPARPGPRVGPGPRPRPGRPQRARPPRRRPRLGGPAPRTPAHPHHHDRLGETRAYLVGPRPHRLQHPGNRPAGPGRARHRRDRLAKPPVPDPQRPPAATRRQRHAPHPRLRRPDPPAAPDPLPRRHPRQRPAPRLHRLPRRSGLRRTPHPTAGGALRPHNLGAHLLDNTRDLDSRRGSTPLVIEVTPDQPAPPVGLDYLRLGAVHLRAYISHRHALTPAEDEHVTRSVTDRVRAAAPLLDLLLRNAIGTPSSARPLLDALAAAVPVMPYLGYLYFETVAEYLMLHSTSRTSRTSRELAARGEMNNHLYKQLAFAAVDGMEPSSTSAASAPTTTGSSNSSPPSSPGWPMGPARSCGSASPTASR